MSQIQEQQGGDQEQQETTTSELFVDSIMKAALHPTDMQQIHSKQIEAFKAMKNTNEQLQQINDKCSIELPNIQKDFQIHQFMMKEMKSDLEFITKALADIRRRLGIKEPERKDDDEHDVLDLDDEVLNYSPVVPTKVKHVNAETLQEHVDVTADNDDMMDYVN